MADEIPERIVIQYPTPVVDDGRFPAKRCAGDTVAVSADVFRDGHELLRAVIRYRGPGDRDWREKEMRRLDAHLGGVRWAGEFVVVSIGRWEYAIEAWTDVFGTWRDELARKVAAGQHDQPDDSSAARSGEAGRRAGGKQPDDSSAAPSGEAGRRAGGKQPDDSGAAPSGEAGRRAGGKLEGELSEGELLLEAAAEAAARDATRKDDQGLIEHALLTLGDDDVPEAAKHDAVLGPELFEALERTQERHGAVRTDPLAIEVDRLRARFGSWYELFPRSFGGLKGVQKQLPRLAELGFDVVYLPPIHPIGHTNRKGRDNVLTAGPTDPGSPWAIGNATGGHDAVHPELGTKDDVIRLTRKARELGLDIALDFAIQCSADHPWLTEHPDWFHLRPDGTLKYAENPPKRYQDIYNVNWESPDWRGLWDALSGIMLAWVDCGVKVFRVDNPHTKPFRFWAWLIEQVHAHDRDVVFLAEAFTRRAVMRHLAKLGFSQSYTYFTWKNSRWELTEYVHELASSGEGEYFRPNFFANTPDILHAYLQHGGRPAFEGRLVLAATLSPSYGIYSGYENYEDVAVREGSEEYLHSEKYELRERILDGPLLPLVARINQIRRDNPAFQRLANLTFLDTANDALIAYAKQSPGNTVITVVNLDPHQPQEGAATVPAHLGLPPSFTVHDLISDERFAWRIGPNYVRLEPGTRQAHVLRVET